MSEDLLVGEREPAWVGRKYFAPDPHAYISSLTDEREGERRGGGNHLAHSVFLTHQSFSIHPKSSKILVYYYRLLRFGYIIVFFRY